MDEATRKIRVGMCTGQSRLDDSAFIFSAWSGLKRAREELGADTAVIESAAPGDDARHLGYLAENGYRLVWGVGYVMSDVVVDVARTYPNTSFGIIDAEITDIPPNVVSVTFREHEGAFLAGYVAALVSESGKIGFVGGMDVPLIEKFKSGFRAGVTHGAKGAEVIVEYANSFLSYAKGKAVAEKLYGQGCDVVFHAAGTVGKGVIRYAKDHDKLAIGVDIDQSFLAPSSVITSMIKDVEGAVLGVIKEFSESRLSFGVERQLGLADGAIRLAPLGTGAVPPGLDAELEDIQRKVISGELSVPETENLPG